MPAKNPEDLHELFVDAVNARDLDAIMDLYEPDAVGVDLDGNTLQGSAALREFLGGFLAITRSFEGTTRKAIAYHDVALTSSTWRATIQTPDGQTIIANGTTAEIARRQRDGTWKFAIDDPQFIPRST